MDCCKWRKMIKDVRWSGWVWVGECFFWYWPTRVVPDKRPLNGCVCVCVLSTDTDNSFDTVGWASGKATGLYKLSDWVFLWLSVCSDLQIVCIWSSWCHSVQTLSSLASFKCRLVLPFWYLLKAVKRSLLLIPANPGCPGNYYTRLMALVRDYPGEPVPER